MQDFSMSVLTFQRKQRALGDIHFCFLSQLAYNSKIREITSLRSVGLRQISLFFLRWRYEGLARRPKGKPKRQSRATPSEAKLTIRCESRLRPELLDVIRTSNHSKCRMSLFCAKSRNFSISLKLFRFSVRKRPSYFVFIKEYSKSYITIKPLMYELPLF